MSGAACKCKCSLQLSAAHIIIFIIIIVVYCPHLSNTQLQLLHQSAEPPRKYQHSQLHTIRYDTIRDAFLTCAQKPTRVSLIYRTESTTKKWKTEKLKSKKRICSEVSVSSQGNLKKKRKGCGGRKDLQKRKVLSLE